MNCTGNLAVCRGLSASGCQGHGVKAHTSVCLRTALTWLIAGIECALWRHVMKYLRGGLHWPETAKYYNAGCSLNCASLCVSNYCFASCDNRQFKFLWNDVVINCHYLLTYQRHSISCGKHNIHTTLKQYSTIYVDVLWSNTCEKCANYVINDRKPTIKFRRNNSISA